MITAVPPQGHVLTTTYADASGASGPCVFTFDAAGSHFTALVTLGETRTFWRGEGRYGCRHPKARASS